jgi:hypothetical protein
MAGGTNGICDHGPPEDLRARGRIEAASKPFADGWMKVS